MPVGVMLASMSSRELSEWMAYYELEPFGEGRADLRAGTVAAVVARSAGSKSAKPSDFMPDFERDQDHDADDLRAKFRALTSRQS